MTRKISNQAFQCYTDTESDPSSALLVVKDGVYYDTFKATEALRERVRRYFRKTYEVDTV
jgi:hypothetical protein